MHGLRVTTRHRVTRKRTKNDLATCISVMATNWVDREQLKTFLKYLEFYIVAW